MIRSIIVCVSMWGRGVTPGHFTKKRRRKAGSAGALKARGKQDEKPRRKKRNPDPAALLSTSKDAITRLIAYIDHWCNRIRNTVGWNRWRLTTKDRRRVGKTMGEPTKQKRTHDTFSTWRSNRHKEQKEGSTQGWLPE